MTTDDPRGATDTYSKLSNLLRTWLTTYGIGFFVFIVSQETVLSTLRANIEAASEISYVVIAGLGAQGLVTVLYKLSTAWEYHAKLYPDFLQSWRYRFAKKLNELYLLEVTIDLFTVLCYVYGTSYLVQLSFAGESISSPWRLF